MHMEICHHYPGGMAACMRYTIDAMRLCKREEIARNLACESAAGSSNFAVTVSRTQKAGTFTQKLSLPNVQHLLV